MSLTRKVLRFGKPLPLVKQIMDRFKAHEKSPVNNILLRTLADIFLALYFLTDHPLYFQRIGFIKLDKQTVDRIDFWNNIFWLLEAVLDIYCDLMDIAAINRQIAGLRASLKSEGAYNETEVKSQIRDLNIKKMPIILSAVRGSADIPVIFHFLGYTQISS